MTTPAPPAIEALGLERSLEEGAGVWPSARNGARTALLSMSGPPVRRQGKEAVPQAMEMRSG